MRPKPWVLGLALAAAGCSTAGRTGATAYPLGPRGVEIITAAHPYVLPPIFHMATVYCARYGGVPTLSSVRKTPFGSLVNTYGCGPPAYDVPAPAAAEPAAAARR